MNAFEKNLSKVSKIMNLIILGHIPIFFAMAKFFSTEIFIAIVGPLIIFLGQVIFEKVLNKKFLGSVMMGFSMMVLSAIMIHLGKGMIEWHFHIFVMIGILSLYANPWTIIVAAATAAVHHVSFYFFLPESIFNYEASLWIVVLHAIFVVFETIAITYLSLNFKKTLDLQGKIALDISPLTMSIEKVSTNSKVSCRELLECADRNSSNVTEISKTSKEISEKAQNTQQGINHCLKLMKETNDAVVSSSQAVSKAEDFKKTLEDIRESMDTLQTVSAQNLSAVEESVNLISKKTLVINDIVFQTKLLSFNASVEAARAGEHGKGFAVVAEEIGILANSSGIASNEINSIVEGSKNQLNTSIEELKNNIKKFQDNIYEANNLWSELNTQIKSSFEKVKENSNSQEKSLIQISGASEQQTTGVAKLASSLNFIDESTNKTLHSLKEIESMNNQLKKDSDRLIKIQQSIIEEEEAA